MEEDEELFEVECFLNTRVKDGKRYYKVRWKGFPPDEDTWEPEENVLECEEVLEAFWRKKRRNACRRQKIRRYRLMSEEEEQDTASTSRNNNATESFGDIEPLGLTRQASKELAMCMNKTRKPKRVSESSSQAGSDVTLTENDVLTHPSSQSTLLSSQTGSDITVSENDFGHGSDLKSSETGSDVLNRSTESANGNNSTTDVIDVSSQGSFNQSDLECSPREMPNKNTKPNSGKTNKIEIISLLSDSEDTENEGTGSQLSETQSPHVQQPQEDVSSDSSPVIGQDSFKTPESTPSKLCQNETPDSKKVIDPIFDSSSKQSPVVTSESDEDPFATPVKRKKRFELSLKKNRKRQLKKNDSTSDSPKTEKQALDESASSFSDERVVKTKGKTQLELLKETMIEVENSEKILTKMDSKVTEIIEPKAKKALIEEKQSNESSMIGDVCPTITELKGIMHKIAKNKNQNHIEGDEGGCTKMDGGKNPGFSAVGISLTPDMSKATTSETMSCTDDSAVEKMVPGNDSGLSVISSDASEPVLVENETSCTFDGSETLHERSKTTYDDGNEMNEKIPPSKTKPNEEILKDVKSPVTELSSLGKNLDSTSTSIEKQDHSVGEIFTENDKGKKENIKKGELTIEMNNNSIGEALSGKDEEKKENKERALAVLPSSSKRALMLTSETTSRVLKNLRFLAAKTRESKSVETTMNLATAEKTNDDVNSTIIGIENNLENTKVDNENPNLDLEEELVGNLKNLNENESKIEREVEGKTGVGGGNKTIEADEKKNDELGLIDAIIKPIYDEKNVNEINSRAEDNDKKCPEINNSTPETEKTSNSGSLTDENEKMVRPETTEVTVPYTSGISRSSGDSAVRQKNPYEPITKNKTSDTTILAKEDVMNIDSEICTEISSIKTRTPTTSPDDLDTQSAICRQGDAEGEETSAQDVQNYSEVDSRAAKKNQRAKKIRSPKKMLKKGHEGAARGKRAKRTKIMQSEPNNLNSTKTNSNQDVEEENTSSTPAKNSLKSKASKRTKMKKIRKINKNEDDNFMSKKTNPSVQNTQEDPGKKNLILDANFSSTFNSGDLIGAIIDEGNRENTSENNQKNACVAENDNSAELVAARQEEDMMIEDDEDFDFELEDFPLEKLLQEEDDIDFRNIPSPPVEPMEVPFASVKTAIRDGDEMTVRAALAGGLELDTLDGASGMTLLMLAAASGQDGVVELLLRRKADVNACQKNGMTALMHACEQGYPETAHVLLLCGADINKQQIAGETALMKACKKGHTDVVEVLLRNGADTRVESKSGHTAQQFAIRGYPELSSLIAEHEKRLSRVVEEAILKCLGDTVSLCKPAILSHCCVVPREGQQTTFPFHYSPQLYNKEVDVILFCIKAVFDDVVSFLFGEDNGVRGVLLNNKSQIPLLHGVRSIFSIDPKSRQNTITLQTHKCNNPLSRIILCIYAVQSKS